MHLVFDITSHSAIVDRLFTREKFTLLIFNRLTLSTMNARDPTPEPVLWQEDLERSSGKIGGNTSPIMIVIGLLGDL